MVNKEEINKIIQDLEKLKKKSYSSVELRRKPLNMNRLERGQDKALNKRISAKQALLSNEDTASDFLNDLLKDKDKDKYSTDLLDFFKIKKKKKIQKHRGGFFVR